MKSRLLCSGSCRLGRGCDSTHNDSFPDTIPSIRRSGRERYKSWLDSRQLHPDGPLNKQRVRAPDNIEAIYRFPWASCPPWLQIAGSAAAHGEGCEGILDSLCRCFPNSGRLIVAQLFTQEHREVCQGETWVCSWQHLANDARHHCHQGINRSHRPPVWSKHTGARTGPSVSLQKEKKKRRGPVSLTGCVGFLWAANQRSATWFTEPSQRSVKCIWKCVANSESRCSGSVCPHLNVI